MRLPFKEQAWLLIAQNYQADTQVGSLYSKAHRQGACSPQGPISVVVSWGAPRAPCIAVHPPKIQSPTRRSAHYKLNHHGRFGSFPIMKFLVGAVREPPLQIDFHGKAHRQDACATPKDL
jgi:hypothetical protein